MLRFVLALSAALLFSATVRADLRIEYEGEKGGSISTMLLAGGKIRVDADANHSIIMDPAAGTMVTIDHGKRRYTRIGPQEMAAMQAKVREAMAELEQAMANVPPELRAQMEQMAGGMLGGKPIVATAASGRSETIDGITCSFHRIEALGQMVAEICLARLEEIPWLGSEERATFAAVHRMQQQMLEGMRQGPLASLTASPFALEGLPLVQVDHSRGKPSRSVLARVSREALPAGLFEPPAGYREEKLNLR